MKDNWKMYEKVESLMKMRERVKLAAEAKRKMSAMETSKESSASSSHFVTPAASPSANTVEKRGFRVVDPKLESLAKRRR